MIIPNPGSISFPEAAILLVSDRLPVQVDKATRTLGTRLTLDVKFHIL